MANNPDYRPRLTIDAPEELISEMSKVFPWGTRNKVMLLACEQLVEAVKQHGEVIIYLLLNGKLKLFGNLDNECSKVLGSHRSI